MLILISQTSHHSLGVNGGIRLTLGRRQTVEQPALHADGKPDRGLTLTLLPIRRLY